MILKRREDRELCADLVKVLWKTNSDKAQNDWAILEDISPSGACFEMERPILPNTEIVLEFPTDTCQAKVVYCRFDKVKYFVGVKFKQGYRWSRRKFKPQHLIQFRLHQVTGNR